MVDEKKVEPTIEWSDDVTEKAAKDPKIAEALRDIGAIMRQALAGVQSGQYASFEEGMLALTGERPVRLEEDDE